MWRPQLFPAIVIVREAPNGFAASSLSDPLARPSIEELTADGLHAVAADDAGDHRIWFPEGDRPVNEAFVIPRDEHFFWRIRNVIRLHRHLDGKPSGRWPRDQRLSRFQLHRATLMLRAWDGVESGASRRHVASILLNPDVTSMRALDWKNAPERRRLARILKVARETIEGGYLRWLSPRRPM
ncbi:DUF2285 domain-containing protein [Phyllobacterium sp. K27]